MTVLEMTNSLDWEIYGKRGERRRAVLCRGRAKLAELSGRNNVWLYVRLAAVHGYWALVRLPVRSWWAEARYRAEQIGYVIRPYDQVADARRWRWQRATRCGLGGLDPESREQLLAAVWRKFEEDQ
jgi:hypothetical protein